MIMIIFYPSTSPSTSNLNCSWQQDTSSQCKGYELVVASIADTGQDDMAMVSLLDVYCSPVMCRQRH